MLMLGHYPLLYCGKDAVLYQCVACGSERTKVNYAVPETGH
ncbi:hypothetical protein HNR60_004556 [Rhodopseudomonas rhenobacensis]|uniref:Uncharacterized protein n=1 Tax=Rhodopseudomonas rhenobacensis TaxID=87461 RepID=A0A7W8E194_9BRAD|nr:hypothetical protein [Rhodopseudomonas rhenobacensis]MBB5049772.1 hypothetical protein [Rhodopseudomonas rhenobacensis]